MHSMLPARTQARLPVRSRNLIQRGGQRRSSARPMRAAVSGDTYQVLYSATTR
ncbi:MAG TPA: hypothetical protein VHG93_09235 [Longimicrobium sp.]|nr:hypothetical protein [Longimicrobium sp.]